MRQCDKCHRESRYVVHVLDTGTLPPLEYDHFMEIEQYWCLACAYHEGNRLYYDRHPIPAISLD